MRRRASGLGSDAAGGISAELVGTYLSFAAMLTNLISRQPERKERRRNSSPVPKVCVWNALHLGEEGIRERVLSSVLFVTLIRLF